MRPDNTPPPTLDYQQVFQASPVPCIVVSRDLVIFEANPAYLRLVGQQREALVGRLFFDALASTLQQATDELRESFRRVLAEGTSHEISLLRYPIASEHNGADRFWSVKNTPLFDARGQVMGVLNCPTEVTSLMSDGSAEEGSMQAGTFCPVPVAALAINRQLEQEQRRFRQLMQQAPGFVAVGRGPNHVFELANNAYFQLVGHRSIIGKPVREALPELEGQGFYELLDHVYQSGQPFIGRAMPIQVQVDPNSPLTERYIDFIYQPIFDEEGKASGIFVQGHDVTEAHELAKTVTYQAAHDSLTGLFNRREFEKRLADAVDKAKAGEADYTLIYLDLDQFKVVNDTCGHAAGDELLRQIGRTLRAGVPQGDTVARLGGDEFAILLHQGDSPSGHATAETLRQLIDDLDFSWAHRIFGCSASLGVVTLDTHVADAAQALSAADSACFMAKERGRNRVQIHSTDDDDLATRRRDMDWVSRLKEALDSDRFVLFAQQIRPTCSRSDDPFFRVELLLRLRDIDDSLIPPMAFIAAAERFNLMAVIDRWVVRTAFDRMAALPPAQRARLDISINLSGLTLSDERFLPFIHECLANHPELARQICFEITETTALRLLSQTTELMLELKALGFRFALDDFGSGMSSLNYLKNLPVDHLKIDGSFIRHITADPIDAAMVEAMAKVASVMGIKTVAEYVDSEPTRAMLEQLRIDYVQGFGIHKPEPFDALIRDFFGWAPRHLSQGQGQ